MEESKIKKQFDKMKSDAAAKKEERSKKRKERIEKRMEKLAEQENKASEELLAWGEKVSSYKLKWDLVDGKLVKVSPNTTIIEQKDEQADDNKTEESANDADSDISNTTTQQTTETITEEVNPEAEVDVKKIFDYWVDEGKKLGTEMAKNLQQQDYSVWEEIYTDMIAPTLKDREEDSLVQQNEEEMKKDPKKPVDNIVNEGADNQTQIVDTGSAKYNMKPVNLSAKDHCRFEICDVYDEVKFLKGVLDDIFKDYPKLSYELATFEDEEDDPSRGRYYNLIVTGAFMPMNFLIDPRYQKGLGIPLILVPVTNGITTIKDWVPLGAKFLLSFVLPTTEPPTHTGIPRSNAVPAVLKIRLERELWPDRRLYEAVDMHRYGVVSGQDYQDLGYWMWMVLSTIVSQRGIKGRYRLANFVNPTNWELVSDNKVLPVEPKDDTFKPLDIKVSFDGKNIVITSLISNNMSDSLEVMTSFYPPDGTIKPLPDETTLVTHGDAIKAPDPVSNYEKELMKVKYSQVYPETKIEPSDYKNPAPAEWPKDHPVVQPTDTVDMQAIFDKMTRPDGNVNIDAIKAQYAS